MRFRLVPTTLILLALATGVAAGTMQAPQRTGVPQISAASETTPPVGQDSLRFLVLGDTGTGESAQFEIGLQAWRSHQIFPYEFAIMLGDNIYGSERPQDFKKKFEGPYQPMLAANIQFHASLGNHDDPNQRYYKPFGMDGQRYYTYRKKDAQFFVLDSNYMDKAQQTWLEQELSESKAKWKIAYFHHPIYSSGGRHGSAVDLRVIVEPLFIKHGVNVVFAGHEHFYERLKPQKGIQYFTAGGSAKLRSGNVRAGAMTANAFDTEQSFMLVEIDDDVMRFQTMSRRGKRVDAGEITRHAGSQ